MHSFPVSNEQRDIRKMNVFSWFFIKHLPDICYLQFNTNVRTSPSNNKQTQMESKFSLPKLTIFNYFFDDIYIALRQPSQNVFE